MNPRRAEASGALRTCLAILIAWAVLAALNIDANPGLVVGVGALEAWIWWREVRRDRALDAELRQAIRTNWARQTGVDL